MSYHREAQYMANMIEIVKADPAKKEDYKRIFENSPLYNHYFKNTDLLDKVPNTRKNTANKAQQRVGKAVPFGQFQIFQIAVFFHSFAPF